MNKINILLLLTYLFFIFPNFIFSMSSDNRETNSLDKKFEQLSLEKKDEIKKTIKEKEKEENKIFEEYESEYDSNSEYEEDYKYDGYASLKISGDFRKCMIFFRGIHFSPSKFTKEQRSLLRKKCDVEKTIYSSAVYDLSKIKPSEEVAKSKEILDFNAGKVKKEISSLKNKKRDLFQELYSNRYDKFHEELRSSSEEYSFFEKFSFSENPQVSTSESFIHCGKYAFGKKNLGKGVIKLDPKFDKNGKPKHPYLGRIYVILIDLKDIKDLDPYFVVYAHKQNLIKVFSHYSNNILAEREVSFPGVIPGKYVVYSQVVKVPTFEGEYRKYYLERYGITERSFKIFKNKLKKEEMYTKKSVKNLINKIIEHMSVKLESYIKKECDEKGIEIYYKALDGFDTKKIEI